MSVGYPASRPPGARVRKPLDEIAWYNGFKEEKTPIPEPIEACE